MTNNEYCEYWDEVRVTACNVVETAIDNLEYGLEEVTEESVMDAIYDYVLHETIDSHEYAIYSHHHNSILEHTDNEDYMIDNFGVESAGLTLQESSFNGLKATVAFWAFYADVSDCLSAEVEKQLS